MRKIGLLGGMSWESTLDYYRNINQGINAVLGGLHSAEIVLYSVDFQPIEALQHQGDWEGAADILCKAALNVQAGGADCLLICTNTMHKVAKAVEQMVDIPLLHIADATADALKKNNMATVGLLGTAFTMEQGFYRGRLSDQHGLNVLTPDKQDRESIHNIIYQELCLGSIRAQSKDKYLSIINKLAAQGAQGVILGCTEIGMLVSQSDTDVKLFDTTEIHAQAAVTFALSNCKN